MTTRGGLQQPSLNRLQTEQDDHHLTEQVGDEHPGNVYLSDRLSNLKAEVTREGRVDILFNGKARKIKRLRGKAARSFLQREAQPKEQQKQKEKEKKKEKRKVNVQDLLGRFSGLPRLNIAVHIVGSRGDVQPFIPIGQALTKPPYGHRVRVCTHPVFKDLVEENGLEFFSIGGDPNSLMAYMVKNPGLFPGRESWKAGEVGKRRAEFAIILEGCWRACIEAGNGMGGERTEAGEDVDAQMEEADRCFIADAIIANPPSYGHIHCAEKLGIPLHIIFTMPWSPTQYFPHPLASFSGTKSDPNLSNFMSYTIMELLAWQGLGDVINGFRMKTLHLDAVSPLWGHMLLSRLEVPFTYIWSPALIPKPRDWGPHINITGFSFLKAGSDYQPPEDLVQFLNAGPTPVYIGFGSIVVEKPDELTTLVFNAVKRAGVRAIVSKGWGGVGVGEVPKDILLIENCPHDWLFQYVSCVVHHGGAGTCAIGIAMGKPTIVIPFFGDQPFWGAMIHKAGAGPEPIAYKSLTEEKLAESIKKALEPGIQTSVKEMSDKIAGENGSEDAAASFDGAMNYDNMRCVICPKEIAVWRVKRTKLRLCTLAVLTLADHGLLTLQELSLYRSHDWYIDEGAVSPLLGVLASISDTAVKTWNSTNTYFRSLSKILKKERSSKQSQTPSVELQPTEEERGILAGPPPEFPVQAALTYPPQHLEQVAYRMASETLPSWKNRSKHRKTHSWSPRLQMPAISRPVSMKKKTKKEHGKTYELTSDTGHFAYSIARTGVHAPVALLYNLANGFHNAPNFLLNDQMVRKRGKITGFQSGVKVAGKGFVLNIYDGFTGILTHPYRDSKKNGVVGFGKGVGRGIGGLIFKTLAAVIGVPGYTLKGIEKQIEKRADRYLTAEILEARLKQGVAAFRRASEEEKQEILKRWKELELTGLRNRKETCTDTQSNI